MESSFCNCSFRLASAAGVDSGAGVAGAVKDMRAITDKADAEAKEAKDAQARAEAQRALEQLQKDAGIGRRQVEELDHRIDDPGNGPRFDVRRCG